MFASLAGPARLGLRAASRRWLVAVASAILLGRLHR